MHIQETYSAQIEAAIAAARDKTGLPQTIDTHSYVSMLDMFGEAVRNYADRPAFTGLGRTLTYEELDRFSGQFATWLRDHTTLEQGD